MSAQSKPRSLREYLVLSAFAGVVLVVAVLERIAYGHLHPIALIFGPPVVTAGVFAILLPRFRSVRSEAVDPPVVGSTPPYRRWLRTGVAAVAVHGVAVVVGIALFLVVDTPVRYLLYWAGYGPFSIDTVETFGVGGVVAATAVVWGLLAVTVVHAARGSTLRTALWRGLSDPIARPRSGALTVGLYGLVLASVFVLGRSIPRDLPRGDWGTALLLLGGLLSLGALASALLVDHQLFRADRPPIDPPANRRGAAQVAVAALLVTSLVGVAGAVRVTETRPTADPEPLPDDPAAAYATALENTDRASVAVSVEHHHENATYYNDVTEWRQDPDNRRQLVYRNASDESSLWYDSAGTSVRQYPSSATWSWFGIDGVVEIDGGQEAVIGIGPGYWQNEIGRLGPTVLLPPARIGSLSPAAEVEWTIVEETDDELVVERVVDSSERYDEHRTRMTIDTERKIVTGGETYAVANESADGVEAGRYPYEEHTEYDVETDVSVDRPPELGSPSAAEWAAKLLAY